MTLEEFEGLLETVASAWRFEIRQEEYPYIVYSPYREDYERADNRIDITVNSVQVEYFTKDGADGGHEKLKRLLDENEIPFSHFCFYEQEEGVTRHVYDCEVL